MRRTRSPAASAAVLLLAAALPAAARESPLAAEEIRRRAQQVLDHPAYQTELPGHQGSASDGGTRPRSPRAGGRDPLGDGSSRVRPDEPEARLPALGSETLMWIVVLGAVAFAAVWLLREAARSRPPAEVDEPAEAAAPAGAGGARPPAIDEIEALAGRGAYGEAVHLLLRRALAALGRRQRLAPAWTSREVLRRASLAPPARDALGELVAAAERFWFGGVSLGSGDYERCAAACRTVLEGAAEGSG